MVISAYAMKKVEAWTYIDENGNVGPILFKYCFKCGRRLKNFDAQIRGYGEVCWNKQHTDKQTTLF